MRALYNYTDVHDLDALNQQSDGGSSELDYKCNEKLSLADCNDPNYALSQKNFSKKFFIYDPEVPASYYRTNREHCAARGI